MKVVIDISDEAYYEIMDNADFAQNFGDRFCIHILNGKPLSDVLNENKGEWIAYDHGMGLVYLKCPFCGTTIDKRHVEHNFCGKCGAKLSGEKSGFER